MKAASVKSNAGKDSLPESEEQKYKQKCIELKKRILEIEESNKVATLALSRTKMAIRRMRLEYAVLLERLEERAIVFPNGNEDMELMSPPPIKYNGTLAPRGLKSVGNRRGGKKSKNNTSGVGAQNNSNKAAKIRDPALPKRPTNAYLIFCELEKERIKQELESKFPDQVIELSKSLIEAWKNLDAEERKPYYKLYEDDRERYQREMSVYNEKRLGESEKSASKRQKIDQPEEFVTEKEEQRANVDSISHNSNSNDSMKITSKTESLLDDKTKDIDNQET